MAAASAAPTPHALDYIGAGTYGCVLRDAMACKKGTEIDYALATTAAHPVLYKMVATADVTNVSEIAAVLAAVDPGQKYTVPIESACTLDSASKKRVLAEAKCVGLRGRIADAYSSASLTRLRMREGMPLSTDIVSRLSTDTMDIPRLMHRLSVLFRYAEHMHACEIAHGDLKVDNILYFKADGSLRFIDYDLMFSYGLRDPMQARQFNEPDWKASIRAMSEHELRKRIHHTVAISSFETYYFPPDNIFMNPTILFGTTPADAESMFTSRFGRGALKLDKTWTYAMQKYVRKIQMIQKNSSRDDYKIQFKANVLRYYAPDKHMVFQMGFTLWSILISVRAALEAFAGQDATKRLIQIISKAMMPMGAERPDYADFLREFEAFTDSLQPKAPAMAPLAAVVPAAAPAAAAVPPPPQDPPSWISQIVDPFRNWISAIPAAWTGAPKPLASTKRDALVVATRHDAARDTLQGRKIQKT